MKIGHIHIIFSGNCRSINKEFRRRKIINMSSSSSETVKNGNLVVSREQLYLGMDFGTSGARYALIDKYAQLHAEAKREYPLYMVMLNLTLFSSTLSQLPSLSWNELLL